MYNPDREPGFITVFGSANIDIGRRSACARDARGHRDRSSDAVAEQLFVFVRYNVRQRVRSYRHGDIYGQRVAFRSSIYVCPLASDHAHRNEAEPVGRSGDDDAHPLSSSGFLQGLQRRRAVEQSRLHKRTLQSDRKYVPDNGDGVRILHRLRISDLQLCARARCSGASHHACHADSDRDLDHCADEDNPSEYGTRQQGNGPFLSAHIRNTEDKTVRRRAKGVRQVGQAVR